MRVRSIAPGIAALCLSGCASLLPSGKAVPEGPWKSFDEAKASYDRIVPERTTVKELAELGFDPFQTPNIAILSYADLRRRFSVTSLSGDELDPLLRDCLAARERCTAYETDLKRTERHRSGNFWLDFLDFRRTTDVTGWRFNALIVLKDDRVVYKLWGGQPIIREREDDRNPLGPLQGSGSKLLQR
jgi:hypothetical protein